MCPQGLPPALTCLGSGRSPSCRNPPFDEPTQGDEHDSEEGDEPEVTAAELRAAPSPRASENIFGTLLGIRLRICKFKS